jgi:hypothetical protein
VSGQEYCDKCEHFKPHTKLTPCAGYDKLIERKGQKMNWLAKVLRRAVVLWCVYGLVQVGILVNPMVAGIGNFLAAEDAAGHPVQCNILGWVICFGALVIVGVACTAIHKFSTWLFNERK